MFRAKSSRMSLEEGMMNDGWWIVGRSPAASGINWGYPSPSFYHAPVSDCFFRPLARHSIQVREADRR